MKTKSRNILIALFGIITIFGCQKDDVSPMGMGQDKKVTPEQRAFESNLMKTAWAITLFEDGNPVMKTDQTSLFSSYVFQFSANHVVFAKNAERTVLGKWNTYFSGSTRVLVLNFGTKPFIGLNESWAIDKYGQAEVNMSTPKAQGRALLNMKVAGTVMPK